jgi:hypothetical protein
MSTRFLPLREGDTAHWALLTCPYHAAGDVALKREAAFGFPVWCAVVDRWYLDRQRALSRPVVPPDGVTVLAAPTRLRVDGAHKRHDFQPLLKFAVGNAPAKPSP